MTILQTAGTCPSGIPTWLLSIPTISEIKVSGKGTPHPLTYWVKFLFAWNFIGEKPSYMYGDFRDTVTEIKYLITFLGKCFWHYAKMLTLKYCKIVTKANSSVLLLFFIHTMLFTNLWKCRETVQIEICMSKW